LRNGNNAALRRSDEYRAFLSDLSAKMTESPSLADFGETRQVANIMMALALVKGPELMLLAAQAGDYKPTLAERFVACADVLEIARAVSADAEWVVEHGNPRAVANLAWAFASLNLPAPVLFKAIADRPHVVAASASPVDLARTVWAFATLKLVAPSVFKAVGERAAWLVAHGSPEDIANTAWAFGTLGIPAPELFQEISSRAEWLVQTGKHSHIAKIKKGYIQLGYKLPSAMGAVGLPPNKRRLIRQSVTTP
jgi:hypothetical protein